MSRVDRSGIYLPHDVTIPTGLLANLVHLACDTEDRTADEQASLVIAARLLEACGVAGHVERVMQTWSPDGGVGGER